MDEMVEELRHPSPVRSATLLLLLAENSGHGYELIERLKEVGVPQRRAASVYRDLNRLENEGLVTSFWATSQTRGPARRVYELTASGHQALRDCAEAAIDLGRTLVDYVSRCENVSHSRPRRVRVTPKQARSSKRGSPSQER